MTGAHAPPRDPSPPETNEPWLPATARRRGDAVALVFGDESRSWRDLAAGAEALAGALARCGVARGDVVAVHLAPQPLVVLLLHALQLLGAAMLPLNLRLAAAETEAVLRLAAPRLLVHGGDGALPRAVAAREMLADELSAMQPARSFAAATSIDPRAPLTVVFTSGTTSKPKGVVLDNANHAASAEASRRRLGHGEQDTWLATLPLFHVGGLAILARSALEGSTVRLEAAFDLERTSDVAMRGEASMISLVPTMLSRMLDRIASPPPPSLRCVLVGGAALSPALARRALDAGLPVSATYGMTEAASQICSTAPGSADAARGSVGRPLDGTELRIVGADGDGWGEIAVRGPTVMRGYLANPEASAAALRGGWLHTGDIGRLEGDGTLLLAGRRDDLLVTGGENVAPLEVERVLDAHPAIDESLVVGAHDDEWGERVVAVVVLRRGQSADAAELSAWCRERIAGYKVPKEFRFADALPRGATGKVLRRLA